MTNEKNELSTYLQTINFNNYIMLEFHLKYYNLFDNEHERIDFILSTFSKILKHIIYSYKVLHDEELKEHINSFIYNLYEMNNKSQ
jgi:hypothetical protein